MRTFLNIFWLLVVIQFITFTQNLNAEEKKVAKIFVKGYSTPKFCGSIEDKEFTIAVDMGEVYALDSLYGFNFQLRYDTTKIKITDFLTVGTLSENCSLKNCSFKNDSIIGYVTDNNYYYRMYGNKPLFALKGKLKAEVNCYDSALIWIDFIEFTDEFVKDSLEYYDLMLKIDKKINLNNKVMILIDEDTLNIKKTDSILNYSLPFFVSSGYAINNVKMEIKGKNINKIFKLKDSIYSFGKVKEISTEDALLLNIDFTEPKIFLNNEINLEMNALEINKLESSFSEMYKFDLIKYHCECLDSLKSDTLYLNYKYEKPDTGSVISAKDDKPYYVSDVLYLTDLESFDYLKIYDLVGKLVLNTDISDKRYIDLNNNLQNGVYFGLLTGKKSKTIKIIKYSFIN